MILANVLNAKIIDDKGKIDGASVVGPQGRSDGDGAIAVLGKVGGELIIGDTTGLFQPRHAFSDLHVNPAIGGGKRAQGVFVEDFVRDFRDVELHIFVTVHGGTIIECF